MNVSQLEEPKPELGGKKRGGVISMARTRADGERKGHAKGHLNGRHVMTAVFPKFAPIRGLFQRKEMLVPLLFH